MNERAGKSVDTDTTGKTECKKAHELSVIKRLPYATVATQQCSCVSHLYNCCKTES